MGPFHCLIDTFPKPQQVTVVRMQEIKAIHQGQQGAILWEGRGPQL